MNIRLANRPLSIPALLSAALMLIFALPAPGAAGQTSNQPAKPPVRVRAKLDGFELSARSGMSPNQVGGASRDIGSPKLFAPLSGKSFTTTPLFQWGAAEPNAKVTFRLSTSEGQTLYQTTTTAGQLAYPADAPALAPGSSYRWTVVPENDLLGGPPAPVTFLIVSGAEDAKTKVDVFVKHRLWYDSIQGYSDLIDRMPNDKSAHAGRAQVYDQLPVTATLADADWRMAQ